MVQGERRPRPVSRLLLTVQILEGRCSSMMRERCRREWLLLVVDQRHMALPGLEVAIQLRM